ncbi:ATPase associated [Planctomycetales bacterium 10988]|nr:ATPase associated [Planctomycetales bacterium 10988]
MTIASDEEPTTSPDQLTETIQKQSEPFRRALEEVGQVVVGQQHLLHRMLIGLLGNGHLLIEGVPGLAKTTAVSCLAQAIHTDFQRLQFTPDLLPADLLGTLVYRPQEQQFVVQKGPIFSNFILADEINRAPAKVQSALLEAMQERQVTIGSETFPLEDPFLVMATQNPVEQEGTYPLPEAQMDRFMLKVLVDYPTRDEEIEILERMSRSRPKISVEPVLEVEEVFKARELIDQIKFKDAVRDYLVDLVFATRSPQEYNLPLRGMIQYGASPRATINLAMAAKVHAFLEGRSFVTPQDIKELAPDVLRHRIQLSYEAEAEEMTVEQVIETLLKRMPIP